MTVLPLAAEGEAAGLAAFLQRLLKYDRAAAVRLQAAGHALAVFGRAPALDVVVVRVVELGESAELDVTVSAGELLERLEPAGAAVPDAVTGPAWAGMLPPRGGWRKQEGLPSSGQLGLAVQAAIGEFKGRVEELPEDKRTRAELDRIGAEIWGRTLGSTVLPLRAAHAAYVFGLLRPDASSELLAAGTWLRLRTPYGSVALRRAGGLPGLGVTPL
ncbi:hypothetical protein H9Y04_36530 [Streptomyces sp. TRM66268-LWL]|uniref:FAD-binding PCMH-type domain-containing protein n=1 Tax=Streptomyces polyasparticus TaxID=2767826 RepID=A0ABR7SRN9_9ACTN|nr:hypothetical protein [Streptomyces polyasparticus]MBC9718053.1 hypothetical protein [Streptomyces polyasparticus]